MIRRLVLALAAGLGVLTAVLVAIALIFGDFGRPLIWQLPAAYHGWVLIQYATKDCPAIESRGLVELIRVPADGRVCTLSGLRTGWRYVRYESVLDGNLEIDRALIKGYSWFPDQQRERFFVANSVDEMPDLRSLPVEWR